MLREKFDQIARYYEPLNVTIYILTIISVIKFQVC